MGIFNQSFLLVVLHVFMLLLSFCLLFIKNTEDLPSNLPIKPKPMMYDFSDLIHIFSNTGQDLSLKTIKPLNALAGFELSLFGSYQAYQEWLQELQHKHPDIHWSHIRLQQSKQLNIDMEGFQDA